MKIVHKLGCAMYSVVCLRRAIARYRVVRPYFNRSPHNIKILGGDPSFLLLC